MQKRQKKNTHRNRKRSRSRRAWVERAAIDWISLACTFFSFASFDACFTSICLDLSFFFSLSVRLVSSPHPVPSLLPIFIYFSFCTNIFSYKSTLTYVTYGVPYSAISHFFFSFLLCCLLFLFVYSVSRIVVSFSDFSRVAFFNCSPFSFALCVCVFCHTFDVAYCRIFYKSLRFLALCGILILFKHGASWHNLFVSRLSHTHTQSSTQLYESHCEWITFLEENKNNSLLNSNSTLLWTQQFEDVSYFPLPSTSLAPEDKPIESGDVE